MLLSFDNSALVNLPDSSIPPWLARERIRRARRHGHRHLTTRRMWLLALLLPLLLVIGVQSQGVAPNAEPAHSGAPFLVNMPGGGLGFVLPGGNGGLVNLPGGGGYRLDQELDATLCSPPLSVSFAPTGEAIVTVIYAMRDVVVARVSSRGVFYRGTVFPAAMNGGGPTTAILPGAEGQDIVTKWVCTCHPNVEQVVITHVSGSNLAWYSDQHDRLVEVRQKRHPVKTQ